MLLVLLLAAVCCVGAVSADSGDCGDDLTWTFTDDTLTISGTGAMYDYDGDTYLPPWCDYVDSISTVEIGEGVTSIGDYAFSNCCSLESINIPESVTTIGNEAFQCCCSPESITIPASVKTIGEYAFANCCGLTEITFAEESQLETIGANAFNCCCCDSESSISIEIPASVKTIGEGAFGGCCGLKTLTFAEGSKLESIGVNAFNCCESLESIEIPASVTSIGERVFSDCSSLNTINVNDGNTKYKNNYDDGVLFSYEDTLGTLLHTYPAGKLSTQYEIPVDVTSIGAYAFYWCTNLTEISIPASVMSIGSYAFSGCTDLTEITFGGESQLESIGDSAFYGCTSLTSISIPARVTSIGKDVFQNSGLTGITFVDESQLESIGDSAFYGCTGLTEISIPAGVTSIGKYVFQNSGLTGITFVDESQLESIGDSAFSGCSGLTSITIPASVTSIGEYAFSGCSGLTSIEILASVTSIDEYAFSGCSALTSITFSDSSKLSTLKHPGFTSISSNSIIYYTDESLPEILDGKYLSSDTALAKKNEDGSYTFTSKVSPKLTLDENENNAPAGVEFCGWYEKSDVSPFIGTVTEIEYNGITATVKTLWLKQEYTVTFDAQGHGTAPEEQIVICGNTVTDPGVTAEGYTLEGWYKEAECENAWDFASDIVVENTILYAKWTAGTYTVTFDANGGSPASTPIQETYGEMYTLPGTNPTRTGYTFDSWYTDASGGDKITTGTEVKITAAQTLYAHWIANKTTITLSQTDATTTGTASITATYNSSVHDTITNPQRTGYDFAGWYSAETSGVKVIGTDGNYVDAAEFVSGGKWIKDTTAVTLYANWTASKYTVTFDKNGGDTEASPKEISETYDSNYVLPTTAPEKDKYDFAGWYTTADGGDKVTTDTVVKTASEHTIYAHWDGKPYEESVNEEHVADFSTKGLPVVKVDVGKNDDITKVKFQFKNGKPAVISTNPPGFKNTKTFGNEFYLEIEGEQTGDVTVFFTADPSGHYFLAHYKNNVWEFLKAVATEVAGQYKAVVTKESGFSPFQIVSAEPEDVPQSHSSSRDYGASIWLPATAEPTAAPTAEQPTQAVPTASPVKPTQTPASTPAPFIGLLAGLGAAAVLFGLRRR